MVLICLLCSFLCSGYSQEVVCYTLGNIPQMPSAPRLVRAGVTWITLQWSRPEGCSPEEVITYTLDIQEDENVSLADHTSSQHLTDWPSSLSFPNSVDGFWFLQLESSNSPRYNQPENLKLSFKITQKPNNLYSCHS